MAGGHRHTWTEVARTGGSAYYECPCGASKVVSITSKPEREA